MVDRDLYILGKVMKKQDLPTPAGAFTVDTTSSKRVSISTTSVVDLGAGIHWYLKHIANGAIQVVLRSLVRRFTVEPTKEYAKNCFPGLKHPCH